ncbi:hypothetical protein GCM10023156_60200 [Novipirellula rosea]|uniref:Uncharacterized protein n=1 Tax=Novipirellula rosea TaxID=1031540 RepID=A0ABP8NMF5_9BACT
MRGKQVNFNERNSNAENQNYRRRSSDESSIPTSTAFFDVLNEIEEFQNEHRDVLCFDHYETLMQKSVMAFIKFIFNDDPARRSETCHFLAIKPNASKRVNW